MLTTCWILFIGILNIVAENGLSQHTRHERTRYVSGKNQIYSSGYPLFEDLGENKAPFVKFWERPLQKLESSMNVPKKIYSRPLFSWDFPNDATTRNSPKISSTTEKATINSTMVTKSLLDSIALIPKTITDETRAERQNRAKDSSNFQSSSYTYLKMKPKKKIWSTPKELTDAHKKPNKIEEQKNQKKTIIKEVKKKKLKKIRRGKTYKEKENVIDAKKKNNNITKFLHKSLKNGRKLKEKQRVWHYFIQSNSTKINSGCIGKCFDTIGSKRNSCSPGFRLVEGICSDINECLLRNGHGPCQDQCTNTPGSYTCSCENFPGTSLSSDNHTCKTRECDPTSAGCSHSCISVSGITYCVCPDGFELGEDWKTCKDIDECSNPEDYKVSCTEGCINTIGSYKCSSENETGIPV